MSEMRYVFEAGKARRVMHIMRYTAWGTPTMEAICGQRHQFNRSINAPWGLGRRVCKKCRAGIQRMTEHGSKARQLTEEER